MCAFAVYIHYIFVLHLLLNSGEQLIANKSTRTEEHTMHVNRSEWTSTS